MSVIVKKEICRKSNHALGLIATKEGSTLIFDEKGHSVLVTVLKVMPNYVTQIKTAQGADHYNAIQLTTAEAKAHRVSQPLKGHFKKALADSEADIAYGKILKEFRVSDALVNEYSVGQKVDVSLFAETQLVDVTGTSKGKGFAGVIKRHNFAAQNATHGNSLSHRVHGSTGQNQSPGKVFKGKKMAGQMGNVQVTEKHLKVVQVNLDEQFMLVQGAVPGPKGSFVFVRPSVEKL
jgi:large subunit ribosomal protein L3